MQVWDLRDRLVNMAQSFFIAGNVPLVSEIAPLIIMSKLDLYDVQGASVVALLMLAISFLLILFINLAQWSVAKRISPIR